MCLAQGPQRSDAGEARLIPKAIVILQITQERDDEGFGGNTDSQINGNARTPLACCTVGRTRSRNWYNPLSAMDIQNMGMFHFNALSCFILFILHSINSYPRIPVITLYLHAETGP